MDFLREAFKGGNRFVLRLALIAALGGFLFGYDTGVISGALLYIEPDFKPTGFEAQAFVGALLAGAVIGAVISGWSADAISRRRITIVAGGIYVVGALASAAAQSSWELIWARFALGIAVGAASFVGPMYISELAPKKIRGGVTSFNQLMVVSGIFLSYIVNWAFGGAARNWRWMLGLAPIPGAALTIGMYFQPFSPRWLVGQGRDDEAREVKEIEDEASSKGSLRDLLAPGVRAMVVALTALGVFFASSTLKHDAPGIALVCLIVYIASFAVGLGPVFWPMISEIFPLKVRSAAMSVSTVANWAANFLVATFFLTLTGAISVEGTFWLYAGFGVAAIIFFALRLPETKSRSLEEISDEVTDEAVT